jgi:nuclear pore complex protein Nup93
MIGTPGLTGNTASFFGEEANGHIASNLLRGQTARDLRDKERLYIDKVDQLNRRRIQNKIYPIMQQFAQVEEATGGDGPKQLFDAYCALGEITKENPRATNPSDSSAIKERHYAAMYLDDNSNSPRSIRLKKQILDGSRTYLEKAFYRELENLVDRSPREAQLGGRPTVINKVRAYIRVRSARRDLAPDGAELQQIGEDGDYCWIMIFYLLRTGHTKEALEYVETDSAFQSTDKRFISYLKSYVNNPDRRLNRKLQEMINGEYAQRLKIATQHTVDPYRMACYKIVGRCDLSSRNLDIIGQGVEDWTWLQFSLARQLDRSEEIPGESFGLEQICETMTEIGQKHFQKGQAESSGGYGTYFFLQILAGMFEQAVEYLHSYNPVSAVHFAISLAYYGLLRVSDYAVAGNELRKYCDHLNVALANFPIVTYSTTQQPLINFVPLIAYYTAAFRTALPVSAVDYLSLICLNSDLTPATLGAAQTSACHECLRQLCLETREFPRLLGDIRSDGTRIVGAIEEKAALIKLETHHEFLKAVTVQAAAIANERGQIADAVLLYHLSEDYNNVVSILNRALADAVTLDLGEAPMQLQPLKPRRRNDPSSPNGSRSIPNNDPQSSLSLTQSTSSPVELAQDMISLYNETAAYYNTISATNRDTCGALIQLLSARANLESNPPQYMAALEILNNLNILPLQANGSIPVIRAAASAFGSLPQLLARCAGVSVVWAVRAIGGERDRIMSRGSWDAGYGSDMDAMKEQLNSMAKDLMVFAGLVKYKLPARVYDLLTRAGGDVGVY